MSWRTSDAMSERKKFIELLQSGQRSLAGLCREFGISRPTGYKWAARYEAEGTRGLEERSRVPHHSPQETPEAIRESIIEARELHPTWGPLKLRWWLEERRGMAGLPAPSTIGDILKREGLIHPRRRRRPHPPSAGPYVQKVQRPNQEWNADFKGEFRMGSGEYCYPLTVTDAFSRYLLEVRALEGTGTEGAWSGFQRAFEAYGLPEAIRTDNGVPFASTGLGRISKLGVWFTRLGIRLVRTRPGHPQDNGRHERMHRTLKAETTRPPAPEMRAQQRLFDRFRADYNHQRPHQALGQQPPVQVYRASSRRYPARMPEVEYPSHYEVRKVTSGGIFRWRSRVTFVSQCLVGERIGLVEVDDGLWRVYFAALELGILDETENHRRKIGRVLPMSPD